MSYIDPDQPFLPIEIYVQVIDPDGNATEVTIDDPEYLYPHKIYDSVLNIKEYQIWLKDNADKGIPSEKRPPRFTNLTGIWATWTSKDILSENALFSIRLTDLERELIQQLDVKIYIFMGFSTDVWDRLNDEMLDLNKRGRLLRGGIQLATRYMPQGSIIQIPLTKNIGLQNVAHVIVHIDAEPDLGRKGFQPEHVDIAKKLATGMVSSYGRNYWTLLRKKIGTTTLTNKLKLQTWIDAQRQHANDNPVKLLKTHFFDPVGYLPTTSKPLVEQDVVALFNQMLSAGVIRGLQLLSSSQYEQYDGLYRTIFEPPYQNYVYDPDKNPLGIEREVLPQFESTIGGAIEVLEYKHNLDALMEDFDLEVKDPNTINLVIAWDIGEKWSEVYSVTSYLTTYNIHHRQYHGVTHRFENAMNGGMVFFAIILSDLVSYLNHPDEEASRQAKLYD